MSDRVTQFDALAGLAQAAEALEVTFAEIDAIRPRLGFQLQRVVDEMEKAREQRDALDIYDEAEAAAILKVKEDHLASMRRQHGLPHVAFGPKVRYTRQHLEQITAYFDTRNAGKPAMRKAA